MKVLTRQEVLELVPQQPPFRFIDEIIALDDEGIVAAYTFRPDESFYEGHFPGNPITPGVILLEAMAQTGVVAFGIYLAAQQLSHEEIQKTLTMFTEAEVDFTGMVKPGDRVTITGKKVYFRRLKLKAEAEMKLDDGSVVCRGTVAGIGVRQNDE